MKNGAPKNAVTTPIGISSGASRVRAPRSVSARNAAAEQRRQRQDHAVTRADHQPDRVRHDDADETDQAGDGDCGGGAERRRDDQNQPGTAGIRTETRRLLVADRHHVELPSLRDHHDAGDQRVRQEQQHVVPTGGGQPAEDPGVDLADRFDVPLLHVALPGREERGHRDARRARAWPACGCGRRRHRARTSARPRPERRRTRRTAPRAACRRRPRWAGARRRAATRSRRWRRARHRPRHRAGTGRPAGCGRRPGSWLRTARASPRRAGRGRPGGAAVA